MKLLFVLTVTFLLICFSDESCKSSNQQQAQSVRWQFVPALKQKRALHLETTINWVQLENTSKDYFASYPFSIYKGLNGNFGVLTKAGTRKGKILFSIANEKIGLKRRAVPMDSNCHFNCEHCSSVDINGPGAKCVLDIYHLVGKADYKFEIKQIEKDHMLKHGDMCGAPNENNEPNYCGRELNGVVGDIWEVSYVDSSLHYKIIVGKIFVEGAKGEGIDQIIAVGEWAGCRDCENGGMMVERRIAPTILDPPGTYVMRGVAKSNCDECNCDVADVVSPMPMISDFVFRIELEPMKYRSCVSKRLWNCHTLEECGHEPDPDSEMAHRLSHNAQNTKGPFQY